MPTTITLPDNLTPRAEKTLRQASEEASRTGAEGFIGVEHIFLAILADQRAIPTQVMGRGGTELLQSLSPLRWLATSCGMSQKKPHRW